MELIVKTFVVFWTPGVFVAEETFQQVSSRDPKTVKPPIRAYSFRFCDQTFVTTPNGETLKGELRNWSPRYWIGGKVYNRAELPTGNEYEILRANAESNGWDKLIRCPGGNWQPLEPGDILWTPNDFDPELWAQSQ